jgi:hypothetical protein
MFRKLNKWEQDLSKGLGRKVKFIDENLDKNFLIGLSKIIIG